jgi:hypothetical protein
MSIRSKRLLRVILTGLVAFVISAVWISQQFPALTHGPKSSVEIIQAMLHAPKYSYDKTWRLLQQRIERAGIERFLKSCELPPDCEERLLAAIRDNNFREVTVPFVCHLYELYGMPVAEGVELDDLAYAEAPTSAPKPTSAASGLSTLIRNSDKLKHHARSTLILCDALFLELKTEAHERQLPVERRYSDESYQRIKALVREVAAEYLPADEEAGTNPDAESSKKMLHKILEDDERLSAMVEVLSDFIRMQAEGWLDAFLDRQRRHDARCAWQEDCLNRNALYEIADYARSRARRRLVVHIVVDGLQGKLLEGLTRLSDGQRDNNAARYVADLVRQHQAGSMQPAEYGSHNASPLGHAVIELAEKAPRRLHYLANAKKYLFASNSVRVNVASVESPTISVRNLQIAETGHTVAGEYGTGIPNFTYLDRATGRGWYFWGGDVAHLSRIIENREDEIPGSAKRNGAGARTLFERLKACNTISHMASDDTGALEKVPAEMGLIVGGLQRNFTEKVLVAGLRRRAVMEKELNLRRQWLMAHRHLSESFLGALIFSASDLQKFHEYAKFIAEHDDEGLPDYLLWYDPWPDHFAHPFGPFSDEIIGYRGEYDRFDFYLGKVIDVYRSVQPINAEGTYFDRTLFGLVSDHGMIYTPRLVSIEDLLLKTLQKEGLRIQYRKFSVDEGEVPVMRSRQQTFSMKPFDVIVGSTAGGSCVLDLFPLKGLQGDDSLWRIHPDYHQLRNQQLMSGQRVNWIKAIQEHLRSAIDLAVVREYGPEADKRWPTEVQSVVRIVAPDRGEARIWRMGPGTGSRPGVVRYRYEILGQRDPLELVESVRSWLLPPDGPSLEQARAALRTAIMSPEGGSDGEWLKLLSCTLRPDVVHQLSHLYDTDRAGTINIFPLRHVGMNSAVPGRHAGETFEEKNGIQIYFGAGLNGGILQTARNGSLPVTLYHWLAGDHAYRTAEPGARDAPQDQFGYPSLLGEKEFTPIR